MTHADDVERMLDAYRDRIGLAVEELATPALVLDLAVLARNIAAMQQRLRGGAALRPHGKAHKSPEIAALQLRAGAIGIMTATVWEALALARAGIPDILVGNIVRGMARCAAVAEIAGHTDTTALVDDTGNADELAAAARQAGVEIDVLVDLDVGQHRTGARTPDEAVEVARHVSRTPGLRLRGVHGYEGHVSLEQDAERRRSGALEASERRSACADAIRDAGGVVEIVSAGGTGMWDSTGRDPRVSELHPGSYVFMDAAHWRQVPEPEASLHVLATVLSRKGRDRDPRHRAQDARDDRPDPADDPRPAGAGPAVPRGASRRRGRRLATATRRDRRDRAELRTGRGDAARGLPPGRGRPGRRRLAGACAGRRSRGGALNDAPLRAPELEGIAGPVVVEALDQLEEEMLQLGQTRATPVI